MTIEVIRMAAEAPLAAFSEFEEAMQGSNALMAILHASTHNLYRKTSGAKRLPKALKRIP